eukprot:881808-Rhodomonas_salina.5
MRQQPCECQDCEVKYKQPRFQHNVYQECGCLYLIWQCICGSAICVPRPRAVAMETASCSLCPWMYGVL